MKPLNYKEVENLVEDLKSLIGARLQDARAQGTELALGLYLAGQTHWVWLDLQAARPLLLHFEGEPPKTLKGKLPVALFLSAHGKSLRLTDVTVAGDGGRVVELKLGQEPDPLMIELRLFPHGENVIVTKGDKKISFNKVKDLKASDAPAPANLTVRSLEQIKREWLGPLEKKTQNQLPPRQRELEKKKKGLERLKEDLAKKNFEVYFRLGEWLKAHEASQLPEEFKGLLDFKGSRAANIEKAFEKAKSLKRRYDETNQRISKLQREILDLESAPVDELQEAPELVVLPKKNKKSEAKFRTLKLPVPFEAYLGRSAKDNLLLLREAQAWDVWMHLRDKPGAHVIIRRPKSIEVPDSILDEVIHWLVRETASKNFSEGDMVEVQIQEARYVRPIKGDTLGRVTVQNPKHRRLRLKS